MLHTRSRPRLTSKTKASCIWAQDALRLALWGLNTAAVGEATGPIWLQIHDSVLLLAGPPQHLCLGLTRSIRVAGYDSPSEVVGFGVPNENEAPPW